MSIETGVVIGLDKQPIFWHLPPGRSGAALPDSRGLWDVLWENRKNLLGFAHSHPGRGVPKPSPEDVTTFSAVERALGMKCRWWIATEDAFRLFLWVGPGDYDYECANWGDDPAEHAWLEQLRIYSYAEAR